MKCPGCSKPVMFVYLYHWDSGATTESFRCELHKGWCLDLPRSDKRLETLTLEEYEIFKIKEAL